MMEKEWEEEDDDDERRKTIRKRKTGPWRLICLKSLSRGVLTQLTEAINGFGDFVGRFCRIVILVPSLALDCCS